MGYSLTPAEAAALLIIPSLVTNVWQYMAGPHRGLVARRIWPMLLTMGVVTWGAAGLLTAGGATHANTAPGVALVVYCIAGFAKVEMRVARGHELWLSPVIGVLTGVVTGATGVLVIPSGPYLQALGLERDDLVQALGLSFAMSTGALAAGLASRGAFHVTAAGNSALCTVPALGGMCMGSWIRVKVNPATFRLVFFGALMVLGGVLIFRSAV